MGSLERRASPYALSRLHPGIPADRRVSRWRQGQKGGGGGGVSLLRDRQFPSWHGLAQERAHRARRHAAAASERPHHPRRRDRETLARSTTGATLRRVRSGSALDDSRNPRDCDNANRGLITSRQTQLSASSTSARPMDQIADRSYYLRQHCDSGRRHGAERDGVDEQHWELHDLQSLSARTVNGTGVTPRHRDHSDTASDGGVGTYASTSRNSAIPAASTASRLATP